MQQVHLHAVHDVLQARARDVERLDQRRQGARHRVLRVAGVQLGHLGSPPGQLGLRHGGFRGIVHGVVHFAAKGVQRGDGATAFLRQEQEGVVEAGAALRRLVLAVFVGSHGEMAAPAEIRAARDAPGRISDERKARALCLGWQYSSGVILGPVS